MSAGKALKIEANVSRRAHVAICSRSDVRAYCLAMKGRKLSFAVVWILGVAACKPSGTPPTDAAPMMADASAVETPSDDAGAEIDASADVSAIADASTDASASSDTSTTSAPDAEIRLHHGACFGDCTEVLLKLRADGSFTGRGAAKSLDAATTQELFELADKAFHPPPQCPPGPTDIQYTTTTLVRDGKKLSARHPRGSSCSKALSELEKRLQAIR